jgi:hypothetical protein
MLYLRQEDICGGGARVFGARDYGDIVTRFHAR